MTTATDPFYDFMYHHLSIREWELRVVKDEFTFLQSCGGLSSNDMANFRASVLRYTNPQQSPVIVTIKDEDDQAPPPPALVSLKSMLLEILTLDQADNINKICRHVRPLLDREGIRTFCRRHATHVRSADLSKVMAVLQKEGIAPIVTQS